MTTTDRFRLCAGALATGLSAALHRLQFLGSGPLLCALWFALALAVSCAAPTGHDAGVACLEPGTDHAATGQAAAASERGV